MLHLFLEPQSHSYPACTKATHSLIPLGPRPCPEQMWSMQLCGYLPVPSPAWPPTCLDTSHLALPDTPFCTYLINSKGFSDVPWCDLIKQSSPHNGPCQLGSHVGHSPGQ